jgi:hypothetical protein
MRLQLVGITIGGCFLVYFGVKKPFEDFCDFVFVCGLKVFEELNFNEGLDPKFMQKENINKKWLMFFPTRAPISFLSLLFFPFVSLCRINKRQQRITPLLASPKV